MKAIVEFIIKYLIAKFTGKLEVAKKAFYVGLFAGLFFGASGAAFVAWLLL